MSETPETKTPRPRKGMRYLLIGSLALNLVVAGLMVGAFVGNKRVSDRPPRDVDVLGAYTSALNSEMRRDIGRSIRDSYQRGSDKRPRPKASIDAMIEALRAQPFDAEQVSALMEAQAEASADRRKVAQNIWLEHIIAMSDEERAAYANRIMSVYEKRRGSGGRPPGQPKAN